MSTLFLGEALVDFICEEPADGLAEATAFAPHAGGAVANAAIVASRCGARVSLAGGVGDDPWGRWLVDRLRQESVDLNWFGSVAGVGTPLAFITVNEQREPDFAVYDQAIAATMASLEDRLIDAIDSTDALFFGSNTLVGPRERELTMNARGLALRANKPVLFDPNLRLGRWSSTDEAVSIARSMCPSSLMVKVNRREAAAITGRDDPADAAKEICELGARVAVVTLGPAGALVRGEVECDVPGVKVDPIDTTGAGDVLAGVLIAALAAADFEPSAVEAALQSAVEAASRATEGWGAVDSLPQPMPALS